MKIETYHINYTKDILSIQKLHRSIDSWKSMSDEDIKEMYTISLQWWNKWKEHIFKTITASFEN